MPEPFLKWPGGKRAMINDLIDRLVMPRNYWEPFLGGGALFFAIGDCVMKKAYLSDLNRELIITYYVVQNLPHDLVIALKEHAAQHDDPDHFYKVRASEPEKYVDVAARMIYLNRTCFNGLYRVNKKGKFNVSRGAYKNPVICNRYALADACTMLTRHATLKHTDFRSMESAQGASVGEGDLVFCDPPYHGVFTSYQPQGFTEKDHADLAESARYWRRRGAQVIITNSDTEFTRELYKDFDVLDRVEVRGRIACKASGRAPAGTLIAELNP